jgi:hypothetical protein
MAENVVALFSFEQTTGDLPKVEAEKHYKLVPAEDLTDAELASFQLRNDD